MSGRQPRRCPHCRRLPLEQIAFRHMRGGGPTDPRHQQHRRLITAQPQTQRMLFVTGEEPGMTGFERARPERGPLGGPTATVFFLSAVAAGRNGRSCLTKCSLMMRNAATQRGRETHAASGHRGCAADDSEAQSVATHAVRAAGGSRH